MLFKQARIYKNLTNKQKSNASLQEEHPKEEATSRQENQEENRDLRHLHLQSSQASSPRDWNLQEIHVDHELLHQ